MIELSNLFVPLAWFGGFMVVAVIGWLVIASTTSGVVKNLLVVVLFFGGLGLMSTVFGQWQAAAISDAQIEVQNHNEQVYSQYMSQN